MTVNGYTFEDLNEDELKEIKKLEKKLSEKRNDHDVILLAFEDDQ